MDDELAALGVTVADERAQEASVLGRRLASGAGLAPPLQIPSAAEGEWVGVGEVELFPKVALERLLELARGAAHAGNALRASVSAASRRGRRTSSRSACCAALRYELGEEVPEAPAPPRRNKKEHRLAAAARAEADGVAVAPTFLDDRARARASRRAASGPGRRRPAAPRRGDLGESEDDDDADGSATLEGGLWIRATTQRRLFPHQRRAVSWLWALHGEGCGGIVGDEMGLGKTAQAGGAPGPDFEETPSCVLCVASYDAVHRLADALLAVPWSYAVLDEGQKLRNPDSRVTQLCKRLRTPRRLLLSGTPVQNSLRELWSLFDFAVPGRLGTLKAFDQELAQPIRAGGFAGARPAQVQLAYRCAVALRDLIQPYLLRRTKAALTAAGDSGVALPPKTEHVLLCALSQDQIDLYRHVLDGDDVRKALAGDGGRQATAFRAIAALRKICNHPDLYGGPPEGEAPGAASRSSKLAALDAVLVRWKAQGHRVLVFSQTIAMLDVLEALVVARGWRYGRMDGGTAPAARQATADAFNASSKTFLMLLTTRTGGVGLSLVGADRVVLYDPDWNPQTDAQARERSWRLGQAKPVTIYRLVCAGTIEEKIYHRQIFKQALTNKVLSDAKQRRLFSQSELGELFTLGDAALAGATDSGDVARVEDFARAASADAPGGDGDGDAVDGAALDDDDKQVLEALWDGSPDGALAKVFAAGDDEARQSAARAGLAAEAEREAGRAVAAVLDSRDEARGDAADLFGGTAPGSAALLGAIARRNDRAARRWTRWRRPASLAECRGGGWRKK
ncbi:hypothetical protein JL722_2404 [Aureococcus anophagefferens]|nr:hypothetical protein JL722_2404 [Aureococcus anophagefferens]